MSEKGEKMLLKVGFRKLGDFNVFGTSLVTATWPYGNRKGNALKPCPFFNLATASRCAWCNNLPPSGLMKRQSQELSGVEENVIV
jgi:hypothetical protein